MYGILANIGLKAYGAIKQANDKTTLSWTVSFILVESILIISKTWQHLFKTTSIVGTRLHITHKKRIKTNIHTY